MGTTAWYGSWNNYAAGSCVRLVDSVGEVLGEFAGDYDVDGLAAAYRDAINEVLPEGVVLCGDEFIGPYLEMYPEGLAEEITDAVAGVDLNPLLDRFERAGA